MASHKAPSAGQRVHLGKDAPISIEGTGAVASDSLAAESLRRSGGFASNEGAEAGQGPTKTTHSAKPGRSGHAGASNPDSLENQESYAGTAPSYVEAGGVDESAARPHGKNLTEGGFAGSGTSSGKLAEPGSMQDPSRQAERDTGIGEQGSKSGSKKKVAVGDEQPYGVLGGDTDA
ncbi:hypothetical protein B0H66DRAFT_561925 [Apodospora peruviana]|uniref:Uncharacterized protein n=1 Tax=Apodospora peruviana TaxID=516989 RepID=A0AAE0M2T1_9PEZI|nr:hypothetical protein B0H66DRAFT_561925 [Apodospora peruviana]